MKRALLLALISLLLNGCALFRFNEFGHTPKKPGRYPQFTSQHYLAGELDENRAGYDVTFYDLDLYLNPGKNILGGRVTIHLMGVSKLKTIRFDLHENLIISNLRFSGVEVSYIRKEGAVFVSLPDTLVVGKSDSLTIVYEGRPVRASNPPWSGGVVWNKDKNGNPWIGVACEKEGGSIWFPCKDHLSDEPDSVRFRITVPEGLTAISNGVMESHISKPGSSTFTWVTHYPIDVYNITFYAGRFEYFRDTMRTEGGILNLDYFVLPENRQIAGEHFRQVKDIIRIYSACFGAYPWIKDGFKLVESPFEGMEHQTAIAYGSGFVNNQRLGGDYILVHEVAHEWWGNAVSVSDFSDIWLQEGFATYSEMIFTEKVRGYENSLLWAGHNLAPMINNKLPVTGPVDVKYWNTRDNDVYNKGAMVLHTLRNVLNDSALFFDILQTFFREYSGTTSATTARFIEVVERKTGKDWSIFFEAYLYRREVPVLHWYPGKNEGDVRFIAAKWTNVPEEFRMPVSFFCTRSGTSETIEVSTKPEFFYLEGNRSCTDWLCNKRLSLFKEVRDKNLPGEIRRGY